MRRIDRENAAKVYGEQKAPTAPAPVMKADKAADTGSAGTAENSRDYEAKAPDKPADKPAAKAKAAKTTKGD